MSTKEEIRIKKRKDLRGIKDTNWQVLETGDEKDGIIKLMYRNIDAAEEALKRKNIPLAASHYIAASHNAYNIGDFRVAASYANKSAKLYHGVARESEEEALNFASAMRHEAARRKVRSKKSLLERLFSVIVTITIASFLGGIYFLSPNITGNVVGVSKFYSNWIGGILFIVGLVGVFVYFKFKNN